MTKYLRVTNSFLTETQMQTQTHTVHRPLTQDATTGFFTVHDFSLRFLFKKALRVIQENLTSYQMQFIHGQLQSLWATACMTYLQS